MRAHRASCTLSPWDQHPQEAQLSHQGALQHPWVLIWKGNTVGSVLNALASSSSAAEVMACNCNKWGQEGLPGVFSQVQFHVHPQNCNGKGNHAEINSWYSLLQNIKENLMKCLRWDHYKNPEFINWYHIHWGKNPEH